DPDTTPAAKNKAIPAANRAISTAKKNVKDATAARKNVPAKLPADQIDPAARTAVLRAGRRCLQMVLRLLARNAEHWLSGQLNAYLRDDDEYRAITRESIIRGLAGVITFTPAASPASPAPSPCSSTRSTTPRPPSPATTGPSPTASHRSQAFNPSRSTTSGDLGPTRSRPGSWNCGASTRPARHNAEPSPDVIYVYVRITRLAGPPAPAWRGRPRNRRTSLRR